MENFSTVIDFWFKETSSEQWWQKDPQFDQAIRDKFLSIHQQARMCELVAWRQEPLGALAEIIILDQFSRNMFRNKPESFHYDALALVLAQNAVSLGLDKELPLEKRSFMYMPYMHSESPLIHEEAVKLFSEPGLENNLLYEREHKKIIDRFGRYPHRNKILGRKSSEEELLFLTSPGSSF